MANTPPSILIPSNEWINLNKESKIPAGTKIVINNVGSTTIRLCISLTQPELTADNYIQIPPHWLPFTSNGTGTYPIWAYSSNSIGKLNVRDFKNA